MTHYLGNHTPEPKRESLDKDFADEVISRMPRQQILFMSAGAERDPEDPINDYDFDAPFLRSGITYVEGDD